MTDDAKHQRIAAYLRGQLAERHLRSADVARAVGMTTSAFSRKINGRTPLAIDDVDAILTALGLDWTDVVRSTE